MNGGLSCLLTINLEGIQDQNLFPYSGQQTFPQNELMPFSLQRHRLSLQGIWLRAGAGRKGQSRQCP